MSEIIEPQIPRYVLYVNTNGEAGMHQDTQGAYCHIYDVKKAIEQAEQRGMEGTDNFRLGLLHAAEMLRKACVKAHRGSGGDIFGECLYCIQAEAIRKEAGEP